MSSYPECDQYDCMECPRRDECVDVDEESLGIEPGDAQAQAFVDHLEWRLQALESRLEEAIRFGDRIERILAHVVREYENEGED